MRSKLSDEQFREAARRTASAGVTIEPHGVVERPQSGGAWVEARVWVPEVAAARETKETHG